eukprot:13006408-Alexandrium_andersonii.AAC.1
MACLEGPRYVVRVWHQFPYFPCLVPFSSEGSCGALHEQDERCPLKGGGACERAGGVREEGGR